MKLSVRGGRNRQGPGGRAHAALATATAPTVAAPPPIGPNGRAPDPAGGTDGRAAGSGADPAGGRPVPRWRHPAKRAAPDLLGVAGVLASTLVAAWHLLRGGTLVGEDALAFFFPMYAHLGERLAAGDLPGWSPHQLGGAPFLADPQSGWGYLPGMVLFALLPLAEAARALLLAHLLLAGLATYALGRALGLGLGGALVAAVAYGHTAIVYQRAACCVVHASVTAWLPVLLLGAEIALRARSWPARIGGWALGAVALSQVLAGWIGQGTYYALIALGIFLAGRVLVAPPPGAPRHPLARLAVIPLHGGAIVGWGLALGAAGLLPRLSYNGRTFLAGGAYSGPAANEAVVGGWPADQAVAALLDRGAFFTGGAVLALAALAFLARGRHATPALAALTAIIVLITGSAIDPNPLQEVLHHLLPKFEAINRHWPHRATLVVALAPALLAGATVHALTDWRRRRPAVLLAAAPLPVALGWLLDARGVPVPDATLAAAGGAGVLVALAGLLPAGVARGLVPAALALLVLVDAQNVNRAVMIPTQDFHRLDLAAYYEPGGAGRFLQATQTAGTDGPFRFVGYDPGIHGPLDPHPPLYRYHFADPRAADLIVNNRALTLGLEDVQGYNPVQSRRPVEYLAALNGFAQEYREANVYPSGLASPLLDLLNARYVVVPAVAPPDRADLAALGRDFPVAYADERVRVLRNPAALPRAWIVHEARRVAPGAALPLLAGGTVDPRRVALLEVDPPPLAPAADLAADAATVTNQEPDRLRLRVRTDSPGLLVLSEVHDPGWRATVDGVATPVLIADHLLRAVAVPPGEHEVELRYVPPGLPLGLAISGAALLLLLALPVSAVVARRRPAAPRPS